MTSLRLSSYSLQRVSRVFINALLALNNARLSSAEFSCSPNKLGVHVIFYAPSGVSKRHFVVLARVLSRIWKTSIVFYLAPITHPLSDTSTMTSILCSNVLNFDILKLLDPALPLVDSKYKNFEKYSSYMSGCVVKLSGRLTASPFKEYKVVQYGKIAKGPKAINSYSNHSTKWEFGTVSVKVMVSRYSLLS